MEKDITVVVHPIVLMSVVDHKERIHGGTKEGERVFGLLLGNRTKNQIEVTNIIAVPFSEDMDSSIFFTDTQYMKQLVRMQMRVTTKERVVGWYTTRQGAISSKVQNVDVSIHRTVAETHNLSNDNLCYVVVDTFASDVILPVHTYVWDNEISNFKHCLAKMSALESEEVGTQQLLRDKKLDTRSPIDEHMYLKKEALGTFSHRIHSICKYLEQCEKGEVPFSDELFDEIQRSLICLPGLTENEIQSAIKVKEQQLNMIGLSAEAAKTIHRLYQLVLNTEDVVLENVKKNPPVEVPSIEEKENN